PKEEMPNGNCSSLRRHPQSVLQVLSRWRTVGRFLRIVKSPASSWNKEFFMLAASNSIIAFTSCYLQAYILSIHTNNKEITRHDAKPNPPPSAFPDARHPEQRSLRPTARPRRCRPASGGHR